MDGRALNVEYGNWFGSIIIEASGESGEPKSVLFVTVTFEKDGSSRRRRLAEGQAVGRAELGGFNHLYNRVCREIVGRNYHRECHRSKLPKVLAFVDAEGSRYWRSMGDAENLHIHSIWVVPSGKVDQVERVLRERSSALKGMTRIDGIDIKAIDRGDIRSISRVVSYSSKLMGHNAAKLDVAEDFRVFPV